MEEFLLVDDDFCGNCFNNLNSTNLTSSDSPKIYNLDILIHTVKKNKAPSVVCEKVSVFTAIKDLLSCQFETSETESVTADSVGHSHSENYHLNSTNKSNEHRDVNVQVPLCLPCSLLLQDLYRSFKLFQSLRDGASYISKLTRRIQQTFQISDVRNVSDMNDDAGIQFDEYKNNESEIIQTFEDQFGEEINVKVNPFDTVTRASLLSAGAEFIVDTGTGIDIEDEVNSNGVPSVSVTGTNIKTEMETFPIIVNDSGLGTIMYEENIQGANLGIIEDDPLSLIKVDSQENSTITPFIQSQTSTQILESTTSSIFTGVADFNVRNNDAIYNDDDGDYNPRLGLLDTKFKKKPKAYRKTVYRCELCKFACTAKNSMQRHKEQSCLYTVANANNNIANCTNNSQKKYQCKFCAYQAKDGSNLIRHERIHTGEKPYACPWPGCSTRANHSSNLKKHMIAIHKTRGRNTAQLIEECLQNRVTVNVNRSSTRNYNHEIMATNTSTENIISQDVIPNAIPSAANVEITTEIETTSVRNLDVDIAPEAVDPLSLSQYEDNSSVTATARSRSRSRSSSMSRWTGSGIEATSLPSTSTSLSSGIPGSAPTPTIKPKPMMYNCDFCNFTTSKLHFYRNHKQNDCSFGPNYKTNGRAVAGKCKNPNRFTVNTLKPGPVNRQKRMKCKYCNFQGPSNNIRTHERSHTGEKPFACRWDGCLFRGAHVSNLRRHLNNIHYKKFFCSLCRYSGKDSLALKSHHRRRHPEFFPI